MQQDETKVITAKNETHNIQISSALMNHENVYITCNKQMDGIGGKENENEQTKHKHTNKSSPTIHTHTLCPQIKHSCADSVEVNVSLYFFFFFFYIQQTIAGSHLTVLFIWFDNMFRGRFDPTNRKKKRADVDLFQLNYFEL